MDLLIIDINLEAYKIIVKVNMWHKETGCI